MYHATSAKERVSQVRGESTPAGPPRPQPSGVQRLPSTIASSPSPTLYPPLPPFPPTQNLHALKLPFTHGRLRAGEGGLGPGLGSRAMAMPTVAAAAAALHPAVSTRRVGVGNGYASAAPGGYLAGCRRGAVRARVADAAPVAAERGRQEAPAAHVVEIPVTCYQVNCSAA
jgi:hypothetical protein